MTMKITQESYTEDIVLDYARDHSPGRMGRRFYIEFVLHNHSRISDDEPWNNDQ